MTKNNQISEKKTPHPRHPEIKMNQVWAKIPSGTQIANQFPNIKAVFFDMDGTLFDSEGHHASALVKTFQDFAMGEAVSLTASQVKERYIGQSDPKVFQDLLNKKQLKSDVTLEAFLTRKKEILDQDLKYMRPEHIIDSSMMRLLQELKSMKERQVFHLALISASERQTVFGMLKQAKVDHFFDLIISRDDCLKTKPDPWPYLHAMDKFNLVNRETLIFEDSPTGLQAAVASGALVIQADWFC